LITLMAISHDYKLNDLMKHLETFKLPFFHKLVKSPDFLNIDESLLKALMKNMNTEIPEKDIYLAIKKWIEHDPKRRKKDFTDLFSIIDPTNFDNKFFSDVVLLDGYIHRDYLASKRVMEAVKLNENGKKSDRVVKKKSELPDIKRPVLIIIGGTYTGEEISRIDLATGDWVQLKKLPFQHIGGCSVAIHDKIYCFGGWPHKNQSHVIKISSGFKCFKMDSLNENRFYAAASSIKDKELFISGGWDGINNVNSCENFVLSFQIWNLVPEMITSREAHAACYLNGSVYIFGGSNNGKALDTLEEYDIQNQKLTYLSSMNKCRNGLVGLVLKGHLFAIGGRNENKVYNSVEKFSKNKWISVRQMNFKRYNHSGCVFKNKIYVLGGYGEENSGCSLEMFDYQQNTWTVIKTLENFYYYHSIVSVMASLTDESVD